MKGQNRGKLYGFFSAAFHHEIETEKLEYFFVDCVPEIKEMEKQFGNFITDSDSYNQLMEYKNNAEKNKENAELKYRVEYAHLFLLPEGVYPYESIYRGDKKLLMDKPWEEVRKLYRQAGLMKNAEEKHLEDHISVELGFMSFMSYLTAETLEEQKDLYPLVKLQVAFLEEHLLKWLPQLKDSILKNKYAGIYKPIAQMVESFVNEDLENMKNYKIYLESLSSKEVSK